MTRSSLSRGTRDWIAAGRPDDFRLHTLAAGKRRPRHRSNSGRVTTVVHPAWVPALKLAGGDVSRLRILDGRTVLITNRGDEVSMLRHAS
jgi:hypothetical protein